MGLLGNHLVDGDTWPRVQGPDRLILQTAIKLGVNRVTLSRVVTGSSGISADMAYRLADAFDTSPELWAGMQLQYDRYHASKLERPGIQEIVA